MFIFWQKDLHHGTSGFLFPKKGQDLQGCLTSPFEHTTNSKLVSLPRRDASIKYESIKLEKPLEKVHPPTNLNVGSLSHGHPIMKSCMSFGPHPPTNLNGGVTFRWSSHHEIMHVMSFGPQLINQTKP